MIVEKKQKKKQRSLIDDVYWFDGLVVQDLIIQQKIINQAINKLKKLND